MDAPVNICGLWKRIDKNGKEYLVGRMSRTARMMVFTNAHKKKDTDPDFYMCLGRETQIKQAASQASQEPVAVESSEEDYF